MKYRVSLFETAVNTSLYAASGMEGKVLGAGFQERRKQEVCAAAPRDGFTAVLKTRPQRFPPPDAQ
ncbi:hypothetical protein GCM10008940_13620 [Microbulbifer agarilyticus]